MRSTPERQRQVVRGGRVMGERREVARPRGSDGWLAGGKDVGVPAVQATPLRGEQLVVDRLAQQGVPVRVAPAAGRIADRDQDMGRRRFLERGVEHGVIHGEHGPEEVVVDRVAGYRRRGEETARRLRQGGDPPRGGHRATGPAGRRQA